MRARHLGPSALIARAQSDHLARPPALDVFITWKHFAEIPDMDSCRAEFVTFLIWFASLPCMLLVVVLVCMDITVKIISRCGSDDSCTVYSPQSRSISAQNRWECRLSVFEQK